MPPLPESAMRPMGLSGEAGASQIGLRSGDDRWLVDLADVSEVIPVPALLAVPFTQPWFAGVFALRGRLVSVVDFAAFTGKHTVVPDDGNRLVLFAPKHGINGALLFDQVIGLQNPEHFTREQQMTTLPSWVESIYRDPEQREWRALDVRALVEHRSFLAIEAAP